MAFSALLAFPGPSLAKSPKKCAPTLCTPSGTLACGANDGTDDCGDPCVVTGTDFSLCGGPNSGQICARADGAFSCQPCGALGGACCPDGSGGGACQAGADCDGFSVDISSGDILAAGRCAACGGSGQRCCGLSCGTGLLCRAGICAPCGMAPGKVCCSPPFPAWTAGQACDLTQMLVCASNGKCVTSIPPKASCGGPNQPCCPSAPLCEPLLTCSARTGRCR